MLIEKLWFTENKQGNELLALEEAHFVLNTQPNGASKTMLLAIEQLVGVITNQKL